MQSFTSKDELAYWNWRHLEGPWKNVKGLSMFKDLLNSNDTIVELGCGQGPDCVPVGHYIGLDIAFKGLKKRRNMQDAMCCDVMSMPLKDRTATVIFSNDLLEHVRNPANVLFECCRIIKPGGIIIHCDAWFSRSWRAAGLFTSRRDTKRFIRIRRAYVQFAELKPVRWPLLFFKRVVREIQYLLRRTNGLPFALDYVSFKPNFEEFIESDSDACSSIDPHSVLLFYKSRGFHIIRSKGLWGRLSHRKHIIVQKPPYRSY